MDVGNSHEIAFSMTVQRDFLCQSLKNTLRHILLLRGTKCFKPVMPKSRENQTLRLITQTRCTSLCNHGLFRYSMFPAPGGIIGIFTTFEG